MPEVSDLLTKALFKSAKSPDPDNAGMIAALKNEPPQQDVMPFGVGGPAEPSGSPAGFLGKVVSEPFHQIKRLIDASANAVPGLRPEDYTDNPKAPHPNDPMYDAARDMSLNLMGTGMPFAQKGAAGSSGGILAAGANIDKLKQADRMLGKGQDPEIVRQLTGWQYDAAGKPRFEISNQRDRMMYPNGSGPSGAIFHAPDVYKNYPQLQDIPMFSEMNLNFPSTTGMFHLAPKTYIELSSKNAAQARLAAIHEQDHAIAAIEGFQPGTTVEWWQKTLSDYPDWVKAKGITEKDPYELYHRSWGELNAKNAEARADFSDKERMLISPDSTLEYPLRPKYLMPDLDMRSPEVVAALKALRGQK